MKTQHILSSLDEEKRTAICSQCGPITINKASSYKGKQYWKCQHYDGKYQGKAPNPDQGKIHRLSSINEIDRTAFCEKCQAIAIIVKSGKTPAGQIIWRCRGSLPVSPKKRYHSKEHILSEIDSVNKTGVCQMCGPVRIYGNSTRDGVQRWKCSIACRRTVSLDRPKKHLLSEIDDIKRTAICSHCGPVKIVSRGEIAGKLYWKCLSAYRWARLGTKYGITEGEFTEQLKQQDGKCALCVQDKPLVVDHCHAAEKKGRMLVRGLLCRECNLSLGHAKDSIPTLHAAIAYLEKHACQNT